MISVIIATYNGEKFLIEQLDSIRLQTKSPDEVIIADDCSTDDTRSVLLQYIEQHNLSSWKLINNRHNIGHFNNFVNLLKAARGDLIFFSDQDDIWELNKVEVMSEIMSRNSDITLLRCKSSYINDEGKRTSKDLVLRRNTFYPSCYSQITDWGSGYEMVIRSSIRDFIIENINRLPSFHYHDVLASYVSSLIGCNAVLPRVLNSHRYHDANVTKDANYKMLRDTKESRTDTIISQTKRIIEISEIESSQPVNHGFIKACKDEIELNRKRVLLLRGSFGEIPYLCLHMNMYKSPRVFLGDVLCALGISRRG